MLNYVCPPSLKQDHSKVLQPNPIEWLFNASLSKTKKEKEFWGRSLYYREVEHTQHADVFMCPFYINGYIEKGKCRILKQAAKEAEKANKWCVLWVKGDYDYRISLPNAIIIVQGPDIQSSPPIRLVGPAEITDVFHEHPLSTPWLSKAERPSVGFVGQVESKRIGLYFLKNLWRHLLFQGRLSLKKPPPLIPHIILRKRVLDLIEQSHDVDHDFIKRTKFLGTEASEQQRKEYIQNIRMHPYTLCIRGTGNFSFRFYDTLSLGRIPIVIDTQTTLPFEEEIPWKELIVIVPEKKLQNLPRYVLEFHRKFTDTSFVEHQQRIRSLWEHYLEREAYYAQLSKTLKKISQRKQVS